MALIIRQRKVVEDDWILVRADAEEQLLAADQLPEGRLLLPLALWQAVQGALSVEATSRFGVWLAADDEPALLAPDFARLSLVAVDFPLFRDGRGMSIGRLLRERYGWRGELRAIGDVQRDQIGYMERCGFDSFAVPAERDIHDALNAFGELTVRYQGGWDDPRPLFRRIEEGAQEAARVLAPSAASNGASAS
ncbi:MAG: DUF934 domain-containing protein [Janthinobacterium lividum]